MLCSLSVLRQGISLAGKLAIKSPSKTVLQYGFCTAGQSFGDQLKKAPYTDESSDYTNRSVSTAEVRNAANAKLKDLRATLKATEQLAESARQRDDTKSQCAYLAQYAAIAWDLGRTFDAVETLKKLYSFNSGHVGRKEARRTFSQICKSREVKGEVSLALLNFGKWCAKTKKDFKPLSLIWSQLVRSDDTQQTVLASELLTQFGRDMQKNVLRRIEEMLQDPRGNLSEDSLQHLADVSWQMQLSEAAAQLYGELLCRYCLSDNFEKANVLISKVSEQGVKLPITILDTYIDFLRGKNLLVPFSVLAMKYCDESQTSPKVMFEMTEAQKLVSTFSEMNRPSFDTCRRLLRTLAEVGDVESVQKLLHYASTGNPRRYSKEGDLSRFLAEALWKSGRRTDALVCIKESCLKFSESKQVVRRLRNVFCFCVVKMGGFDEEEVVAVAEWFGTMIGDYKPVSVLWRHLVISDEFADYNLASRLLTSHTNGMREQIPDLLVDLREMKGSEEALRRLIEATLSLHLRPQMELLYGLLLQRLCTKNNIILADEVLQSAAGLNIKISSEYLEQYVELIKNSHDAAAPFVAKVTKKAVLEPVNFELKF